MSKQAKQNTIARCPPGNPPLIPVVVNAFRKSPLSWQQSKNITVPELLLLPDGDLLKGEIIISRYLSRLSPELNLCGSDPLSSTEIDVWIHFATSELATAPEDTFFKLLDDLNVHLTMRTYFCGYSLSLADIVIWATLVRSQFWESVTETNKRVKYKNLIRWWTYCQSFDEFTSSVPKSTNTNKKQFNTATFEELEGAAPGKVVVRFPPEPSGYLHIGHAKAAFLNDRYARQYKGKLIVRFDDTNPRKEKDEYEHAIIQDLKTMGITADEISYTSNYFQQIMDKAEELIKIGKAFCDPTPADMVSEDRKELKPSPYRDTSVEENLALWEKMKAGATEAQTVCLRAKIDYASKNGTMRDPVIYRYIPIPHNRTGEKFKIYPIYNFACPVVDSIEGVTHALRSNEYHDSEEQYYWFIKNIPGLRRDVRIKDFSRLNFTHTVMSKRKLQWIVDEKIVDGWNDPRFPTIQGVVRRGLWMDALRQFVLALGDSKKTVNMDISKLWAENKKLIDDKIPRYTAVRKADYVVLNLDGPETPVQVTVPRHKKNPSLGTKVITQCKSVIIEQEDAVNLQVNEEVTLMDWGNIIITSIEKDEGSNKVKSMTGKLHLEGDYKKTKWKLTWLPANVNELADVVLVEYDTLISVPAIPKDDDWTKYVNRNSKAETEAFGDPNLRKLKKGDQFQLERLGYFVLDVNPEDNKTLYLIDTPDGHTKNVFLSKKLT